MKSYVLGWLKRPWFPTRLGGIFENLISLGLGYTRKRIFDTVMTHVKYARNKLIASGFHRGEVLHVQQRILPITND